MIFRNCRLVVAVLMFVIFSGSLALAQQAASSLAGAAPREVRNGSATQIGHYDMQQHLRLVIGLQHPNLAAEEQFLEQLHTKDSPIFMQFLTAEEWNKRFSPSAADEQAVVDWAQSVGMTVTQRYANRLLVDLEAPPATIEKALGVTINKYQVGARTGYSNDRDPTIPAPLRNIIHSLSGLNSIQVLHPASHFASEPAFADYSAGPARGYGSAGGADAIPQHLSADYSPAMHPDVTNGAYDPSDIYSSQAYDVTALNALGHCCNPLNHANMTPPESSIAIATAGTQDPNDFAGFHASYPTLAYHYQQYYIDGTPDCCDDEGTLDFDWSTAWSNSFGTQTTTAMIYLYNGADNGLGTFTDVYNQVLSDGKARVFSTSWGCEENNCTSSSTMDTDHGIFNAMIGQGWTLVAASGDQGATAGCSNHDAVQYPASDPDVVGTGGTNLAMSGGLYVHEYGWSGNSAGCSKNGGGSTGGVSVYWDAPSYQTSLGGGAARMVPDVALNADPSNSPQNYYFNGALRAAGGTSIVAPSVAGFFAQANAYLDYVATINGGCNGATTCTPLGNGNWYLYYFGENATFAPHYPFYDITSGCNNNDVTAKYGVLYYCAATGYDQVTGWGSFNALDLAWAINYYRTGDNINPVIAIHGPVINQWYKADQTVSWTASTTGDTKPTGIAGFADGWDKNLPDSVSLPTPGAGDGFYGPQFSGPTGSLLLSAAGQGCHTAQVRAFDNVGFSSYAIYGPVCYDTVPPVSTAALGGASSGGIYTSTVIVLITATDAGSGYKSSSYSLDGAAFVIYPGVIGVSALGSHRLLYRSTDQVGNTEVAKTQLFTIKSPTTTALTQSPNPSTYGQPVTFTATVAASVGDTPTGTVIFSDSTTALGITSLNAGVATFTTSALHAGSHSISAVYSGSATDLQSTSAANAQTINIASSKTGLTSSPNPSQFGQTVTLRAKIAPAFGGSVTGTVTFMDGTATLGTQSVNAKTNTATFAATGLLGGTDTLTAIFNGSGDVSGSSGTLKQTVSKTASTTTLVSSLNPSTFGTSVTFTATVSGATGGQMYGSITFNDGAVKLGSVLLVSSSDNRASVSTKTLAKGTHSIAAAYSGSSSSNSSTSKILKQVVQ